MNRITSVLETDVRSDMEELHKKTAVICAYQFCRSQSAEGQGKYLNMRNGKDRASICHLKSYRMIL